MIVNMVNAIADLILSNLKDCLKPTASYRSHFHVEIKIGGASANSDLSSSRLLVASWSLC